MAFGWMKCLFTTKKDVSQDQASEDAVPIESDEAAPEVPVSQVLDRMDKVEGDIRKVLKRGRRQQQLLAMIYEEHGKRLAGMTAYARKELPCEAIFDFVESFVLYCQNQGAGSSSLAHVAKRCDRMLEGLGMEVIVDRGKPFDPVRHNACDVRFDPDRSEGVILEVVRPGLVIQGDIYKPALVVVNKRTQGEG